MRTLRAALNRWVIATLVAWTLLILAVETFKGTNVGGSACFTDPTCGEIGWIPSAAWIGGMLIILAIGFAMRSPDADSPDQKPSRTTLADKLVALIVVLAILVLVTVALTFYQDNRPTADIWVSRS
jgi:hypothetical protein